MGVKIKPKERQMKKGEKERLINTIELPKSGYGIQTPGNDIFSPSKPNTPPPGTRYNLATDQSVKPAEYENDTATPQMSKTDKGINYMMGAATKQYGGKMEGAMKKGCYGAKQMKTGLYQDRMDGKLPQNPMLMQYGMSEKAVKQVGKHIAMPQVAEEGEPLKPKPTMKAAENVSFSSHTAAHS